MIERRKITPEGTGSSPVGAIFFLKGFEMKRKGITLSEVLVVMAIIAILLALILPAVGAARKAAQASKDEKQAMAGLEQDIEPVAVLTTLYRNKVCVYEYET